MVWNQLDCPQSETHVCYTSAVFAWVPFSSLKYLKGKFDNCFFVSNWSIMYLIEGLALEATGPLWRLIFRVDSWQHCEYKPAAGLVLLVSSATLTTGTSLRIMSVQEYCWLSRWGWKAGISHLEWSYSKLVQLLGDQWTEQWDECWGESVYGIRLNLKLLGSWSQEILRKDHKRKSLSTWAHVSSWSPSVCMASKDVEEQVFLEESCLPF